MTGVRARRGVAIAVAAVLAVASAASGLQFQITVVDPAGFGFNDTSPRSPVPGNSGTTLGAQRLIALQAAAAALGDIVEGGVVRVRAYFDSSLPCSQSTAILGRGGPKSSFRDFPAAPLRGTYYVAANADALSGSDQDPGEDDVVIFFNPKVDSDPSCLNARKFSYRTTGAASQGEIRFFEVGRHELTHGLGFLTLVNSSTGARFLGRNDAFMARLEDHSLRKTWPQLSDAERAASAIDRGDLHWLGPAVVADSLDLLDDGVDVTSGHVELRAEDPFTESNVVHWSTDLSPDELMEAALTTAPRNDLSLRAFADLGYSVDLNDTDPCREGSETLCLNVGDRFEVEVLWRDFAGNRKRAGTVPFARDSGLYYFLDPGNVELLIKVLDACGLNQRYWVFYAATTNLEFDIKITDTQTGVVKVYSNLLGDSAKTITDSNAFATCPGSQAGTDTVELAELSPGYDPSLRLATIEAGGREIEALSPVEELEPFEPFATGLGDEPRPIRSGSATLSQSLGIQGNRYGTAPEVAGDLNGNGRLDFDETISLQVDPTDNDVTFDGGVEDLSPFGQGLNRVPRATESLQFLNNGNARLIFTMTSNDGGDLFPLFSVDGVPLSDLVYRLGSLAGQPLDFLNLRVVSATFEGFDGNRRLVNSSIPVASFFSTPWDGDFGVVFSDQAGRGIDRVVLTVEVQVPITESMVSPSTCVPGPKTLCLNNGRFKVAINWRSFTGATGAADARSIAGSDVSGLFYFFDPDNIEVLVKALDACGVNGNFWAFFAATTNVEFTLTVTDTRTGRVRTYFNPLGQTANAITDTSAFPTC